MRPSMKMGSSASSMAIETVDLTTSLPNEIMVAIFHHLTLVDLLSVEQVCQRWKFLVGECFATKKKLELSFFPRNSLTTNTELIDLLRRCGPALEELSVRLRSDYRIEWFKEIANIFPNLSTITVECKSIGDKRLKTLATNCRKIQNINIICSRKCMDKDVGFLLKQWPGLQSLAIDCEKAKLGDSLTKLSSDLRNLNLFVKSISLPGIVHALSLFRDLKSLSVDDDAVIFGSGDHPQNYQKGTPTGRRGSGTSIEINLDLPFPKEILLQISHFSLLEELDLADSAHVNDDVLIQIVQGCPELRKLTVSRLSSVGDRGLSSLSRCRKLAELDMVFMELISDECLYELSEVGSLQAFCIWSSPNISSQGCEAIVSKCPLLERFHVDECDGVDGNRLVDSALKAVESRVNGLVLNIQIGGGLSKISNSNVNHPLLHLTVEPTVWARYGCLVFLNRSQIFNRFLNF